MKYLVLLLLFCVPTLATAQCQDAVSTKDMQDCMDTEWKKSDAELNRVYQESLKKLNKEQCALLKKAQRAWLTSRDAQCQADYKMFAGGTTAPLGLTQCRVTLTQERTKTLKDTYVNLNPQPQHVSARWCSGHPLRRALLSSSI
jgi:uncharacterized protein YecT (DUF1311 family)